MRLFFYSFISLLVVVPSLFAFQAHDQNLGYTHPAIVVSSGVSYVSVQDVPAGIGITSTSYWTPLLSTAPSVDPVDPPTIEPDTSDSDFSNLPPPEDNSTDDPDLPNAGSTDVVLRGISTAGYVSSSSKLSGGFTITGGSMSILATGKGAKEYLSTGLLQDTLSNPTMSLLSLGNSSPLFTNNDWVSGAHVNELTATNFFGNYESDDSGLYISLNEGSYLADISSSDGDDGGCLVEVYNNYGFFDATYGAAKLTGISTNGIVNSGSEPGQRMSAAINIGNFGTDASATKRIIVMAKWSMGVTSDHLEDPRLEVRDGTGTVIATNDDWSNNNQSVKSAISSTGLMGGYRDKDAALILNVTPGFYFMDVYSQDGDSGGSLVEVYDLDLLESVYGWSIGN
jgi:hypothetical protein